ncbi:MAG: SDR family oxidoreductase [Panacagrimonas sp.]
MQLDGRRVILTGASGGIGRAVALAFAKRKAWLVLSGRDQTRLDELATEIQIAGGHADVLAVDLLAPGAAQRLVDRARTLDPLLDIVVNCAGSSHFGSFETTPPERLESLWRTNVLVPMNLIQAALPHMRVRKRGLIVNVGSIFGSIGFPCFATYSATKFALRGFSEALRRELAGSGVDVLYFAPRYTRTALNAGAVEQMAAAVKMNQDTPEWVADQLVLAIEHNLQERYLGWPEKFFVRLNALFPRLVDGALIKQGRQMQPYALQSLA